MVAEDIRNCRPETASRTSDYYSYSISTTFFYFPQPTNNPLEQINPPNFPILKNAIKGQRLQLNLDLFSQAGSSGAR